MSVKTSILVIGAGELGISVLNNLCKWAPPSRNITVTVLLRPATIVSQAPDKKEMLARFHVLGISLLPGDIAIASISELSKLFEPFHTIIGCTGFSAGSSVQIKIARAVLDAGVSRYCPWQFGVDYDIIGRGSAQDLFDEQLEVRDLLRGQNRTEWIIISTGMFTSFLFEAAFGVVDVGNSTVRALGSLKNEITLTTAEDIGRLTAEILYDESPRIASEVVYVAGDTVTYDEVASLLEDKLKRGFKRVEWSVETLEKELVSQPDDILCKYRIVFAKGKGVAWSNSESKTYNAKKRVDVCSLKSWIGNHVIDQDSSLDHD